MQDLPHRFVGLIPFSREITSDEPIEGLDHIPYGSTSFVEETHRRGWRGLSFQLVDFNYLTFCNERTDMLNQNAAIIPAGGVPEFLRIFKENKEVFMRPAHDLKQFTGSIYTAKEAIDFINDAMSCASSGSYRIDPSLPIVVAPPQKIMVEWRWFIVGGIVIDGSMYRKNGQLHKSHVLTLDTYKVKAQDMANGWLPSACCVMDTCLLDTGELKVVEFNCINGSGFYDHDVKKIMRAWWEYHQ